MDISAATRAPESVLRLVRDAKRVIAITHANPDGDALGSLAAFGYIAGALGLDVRLYCETSFPGHLAWLEPPVPVRRFFNEDRWQPDLVVFLDCADEERAGEAAREFAAAARARGAHILCIDHHISNPGFADENWILPDACATGILVAALARDLGLPLKGGLGEAVYLAISSDTGSFTYSNTSTEALALAAEIVAQGLSVSEFVQKSENNWSLGRMHLWGYLMSGVQLECSGSVVVSVVTNETLARFGVSHTDLEGYASWLRHLEGAKVVMMARSSEKGAKISLRSMGDVDVQAIAVQFGGGGHKGAAGIDMAFPPEEAAKQVLAAICRVL